MVATSEQGDTTTEQARDEATLESLPKEVGILLIVVGIGGIMLPGPVGAPFLIMGGVALFPNVFRKLDLGMQKRFPRLHHEGTKQIRRFVNDLESRYPYPTSPDEAGSYPSSEPKALEHSLSTASLDAEHRTRKSRAPRPSKPARRPHEKGKKSRHAGQDDAS